MDYHKKGITVVSILIIVVVLTVLVSTITVSLRFILQDTYKKEFMNEYSLVKSATQDYIIRNSGIIDFEEIQFDLSKVSTIYRDQFDGETIVSNKIDMYVIDLEKIGVYNTTYGEKAEGDDDVYLVSKDKNTVYYQKGFENGGYVYYKAIKD